MSLGLNPKRISQCNFGAGAASMAGVAPGSRKGEAERQGTPVPLEHGSGGMRPFGKMSQHPQLLSIYENLHRHHQVVGDIALAYGRLFQLKKPADPVKRPAHTDLVHPVQ